MLLLCVKIFFESFIVRLNSLTKSFLLKLIVNIFLSITFSLNYSLAYEVDNFTGRENPLNDSTELLDKEIQKRLQLAIEKANEDMMFKCNGNDKSKYESRLVLFKTLEKILTNNSPIGVIEQWAEDSKQVFKRFTPLDQSIYAKTKDPSKILSKYGVAPIIKINNQQIGIDKLGHFFNEGYSIYPSNQKSTTDHQKYHQGFVSSDTKERNEYGIRTTNIYSYADIVANHEGQKFWERLCGYKNDDTSKSDIDHMEKYRCRKDAYILCDPESGQWKLNNANQFTFKDYVNAGWDEAINCNLYSNEIAGQMYVEMNKRAHLYKSNPRQPCPIDPKKCIELESKYKKHRKYAISPVCRRIINDHNNEIIIPKSEKFNYDYDLKDELAKTPVTAENYPEEPYSNKTSSPKNTKPKTIKTRSKN